MKHDDGGGDACEKGLSGDSAGDRRHDGGRRGAGSGEMDVYFTANAVERETAERLMELTRRAFPQAQWNCRQAEDEKAIFAR